MSTIKSSDEHLTLNADGSSKDIKFQANGVEKASISSAGAFTSTTIDATKLTGTIPNFTSTGIDDNADATALTITSAERLGIQQTAPVSMLSLGQDSGSGDSGACSGIAFKTSENDDMFQISTVGGANNTVRGLKFNADSIERMRMSASGGLSIGMTDTSTYALRINADVNSGGYGIAFHNTAGGSVVGSITTSGSATAYNTSSDYRLKENVDYTWDATTRLKQLKPARFNFIADDTNTLVDGFIAHEVQDIVPEAISGAKDAVDSDGNIDPQGIDQSKLVPLLVKTIQELEARIAALEA